MKEYNEFSTFADGSDCRECQMYEKDIKKLNVNLLKVSNEKKELYLSLFELLNSFSLPASLNNESAQYEIQYQSIDKALKVLEKYAEDMELITRK